MVVIKEQGIKEEKTGMAMTEFGPALVKVETIVIVRQTIVPLFPVPEIEG